jgi:hypothetical protein
MKFAEVFADHMMPMYKLLMESYQKAQAVEKSGPETIMDKAQ